MCILPNFEASDLKELERKGKRGKKAEAETLEIVAAEQAMENLV